MDNLAGDKADYHGISPELFGDVKGYQGVARSEPNFCGTLVPRQVGGPV